MTQYDNTNRGVLFKNDRKEKDSHPDYKGSINVDGQEFWVSAWIKAGKKGKFFSMSIQPKEQAPQRQAPDRAGQWKAGAPSQPQRQAPQPANVGFANMDDDIPF